MKTIVNICRVLIAVVLIFLSLVGAIGWAVGGADTIFVVLAFFIAFLQVLYLFFILEEIQNDK